VSADKRLVVTTYHVVREETEVDVVFPYYEGETLVTEASSYRGRSDVKVKGKVVASDKARDLALIKVERLPSRSAAAPLAKQPAPAGSPVYSVGNSGVGEFGSGTLWRLTPGVVRVRGKQRKQADFGTVDCIILETTAPVNPGDSGGPVMNDRGEVVAVVSHYSKSERDVSGNIDVEEVRKFLDEYPQR
jgi:serine protease Do